MWDALAGDYSCGSRISWLQSAQGYSESGACATVASEFPDICPCDVGVTYCGSNSCTQQVWDALAGDYSCGSRISWLQSAQGYSESGACAAVASEFPDLCLCDP